MMFVLFQRAEENAHAFQDKEMKKHRRYQASEDPQCSESQREEEELDGKKEEQRRRAKEGVVDITKLADTPWGSKRLLKKKQNQFVALVVVTVALRHTLVYVWETLVGLFNDTWQYIDILTVVYT